MLVRIPNSTYRIYGISAEPVRDVKGLRLFPDATLDQAPQLDVLHIPGGPGQEALMENDEVLDWVCGQAAGARLVFSVCTGALICGAAGLLQGRRATTYWAALHLLPYFGATPVDERVVVDGNLVCAAGVTAGIDGALRVAAMLRGDEVAETIQLYMQYAPEPPSTRAARRPRHRRWSRPCAARRPRSWQGGRRRRAASPSGSASRFLTPDPAPDLTAALTRDINRLSRGDLAGRLAAT